MQASIQHAFDQWWLGYVLFPVASGCAMSLWTAFITARLLSFREIIARTGEDLYSSTADAKPETWEGAKLRLTVRTNWNTIKLHREGQPLAARAIGEAFDEHIRYTGAWVAAQAATKNGDDLATLHKIGSEYTARLFANEGRLSSIKLSYAGVLFGGLGKRIFSYDELRKSDCADSSAASNRVI